MIYLKNNTKPQEMSIPRRGFDRIEAEAIERYNPQETTVEIPLEEGTYTILPQEPYTALTKVTVVVRKAK